VKGGGTHRNEEMDMACDAEKKADPVGEGDGTGEGVADVIVEVREADDDNKVDATIASETEWDGPDER
jgi:hypothetical protein